MKTGFVYTPIYLEHENPPYLPESGSRLTAILNELQKYPELQKKLEFIEPRKATKEDITMVHSQEYYEKIVSSKAGYLDSDTYLSLGTANAAMYAAGAVLTVIDLSLEGKLKNAFCAVRPPGHHAERDMALGFCIFNNIAIGARYAIKKGFKNVFIVDFDVHHGNGTEHIFYEEPNVFYFSTHQSPLYPGTGAKTDIGKGTAKGTNFNYPLPPGAGDKEFSDIYSKTLPELFKSFKPDIMLVSAGYDLRDKDPLASLNVTAKGVETIVRNIAELAKDIPLIFSLEGGYNLSALAESVVITLKVLTDFS